MSRIVDVDPDRQTYETVYRYQQITEARVCHQEDRRFVLHWQTRAQMTLLLDGAGYVDIRAFRGNGKPSVPSDPVFIISASNGPRDPG